jgi:NADPH:quinone reductase-like Zn-dependent oxidoreductase
MRAVSQAMLLGPLISSMGRKQMGIFMASPTPKDMALLNELLESGKIVPVIERRYPLSATAEALRYLEAGHARGKVVITVEQNDNMLRSALPHR